MKGNKTKAIRKMIDEVCLTVREDTLDLVNAFQIPDVCLAAPIAFSELGAL